MKKSKIFLVTVLCLVLCAMCISTTTFSWFTRPQSATGNKLQLWVAPDDNVSASLKAGNISMKTFQSTDGGKTYEKAVSSFAAPSGGISAGSAVYYRTDITNSAFSDSTVSLFIPQLSGFSTGTKFCLGVNGPTRTYKPYGPNSGINAPDYTVTANDTMRLYFATGNFDANWQKTYSYTVHYGVSNTNSSKVLTSTGRDDDTGKRVFYADVPTTTKQVYFSRTGYTADYNRTQTFTDVQSDGLSPTRSLVFWNANWYDSPSEHPGGYNNCQFDKSVFTAGVNIVNYYKTIAIAKGDTFTPEFEQNSDYIGKTVEFYSGDTSIFTVNKSTGEITALKTGSAQLYTKVIGDFGDTIQIPKEGVTSTVTVVNRIAEPTSYTDVPIVTNLKVAAATADGPSTVSVYWYIKNDSSAGGMKYNLSGLYITL